MKEKRLNKNKEQMINMASFHKISAWEKLKTVQTWKKIILRFFTYLLLISMAFVYIYPFLFILTDSVKTLADLSDFTVKWIPIRGIKIDNYAIAFARLNGKITLWNSLYLTTMATFIHVIMGSLIGYGFARFKFKGSKLFFGLLVLAMIIPLQIMMIPVFILYSNVFKWYDTMKPILVPIIFGYGLKGGLYIFIFRQFFLNMPVELEEAAYIDGCGFIRTFFSVILPTSRSAILVVSILSLVFHWNDYLEPRMYLKSVKVRIMPQELPTLYSMIARTTDEFAVDATMNNQAVASAGAILCLLPLIILYLFVQKKFVEGIQHTGSKG